MGVNSLWFRKGNATDKGICCRLHNTCMQNRFPTVASGSRNECRPFFLFFLTAPLLKRSPLCQHEKDRNTPIGLIRPSGHLPRFEQQRTEVHVRQVSQLLSLALLQRGAERARTRNQAITHTGSDPLFTICQDVPSLGTISSAVTVLRSPIRAFRAHLRLEWKG
jgi:hypothetical protein